MPPHRQLDDKMDEITAMLHSSLESKHNSQTVHENLGARDAAIDKRFDKLEKNEQKAADKTGAQSASTRWKVGMRGRRSSPSHRGKEFQGRLCVNAEWSSQEVGTRTHRRKTS